MTDQEINQRIAEACPSIHPRMDKPGCSGNYTTDLNAMREAEETLRFHAGFYQPGGIGCYYQTLLQTLRPGVYDGEEDEDGIAMLRASARQRAEAFLRALGKWDDA